MKLSVSGLPAYAYTGGKAPRSDQPVVLFIHGAQHDHSVWILQSRYFAHHGFTVFAVDLPGHGRSAGPSLASVPDYAAWILALLEEAGVAKAVLVGHSMGSLIALEAAAQQPSRVCRLALLATAYPMTVSEALLSAAQTDEARALEWINIWSHSTRGGGFSHKPSHPGPGFCLPWSNLRIMERQPTGVLYRDFAACNAYRNDLAPGAISVPTLVILGERDAMTPARAGAALAAKIPEHQLVVVPGAGHALMGEAPDAVLNALRGFLAPTAAQG